jgi:hypothetical protein
MNRVSPNTNEYSFSQVLTAYLIPQTSQKRRVKIGKANALFRSPVLTFSSPPRRLQSKCLNSVVFTTSPVKIKVTGV